MHTKSFYVARAWLKIARAPLFSEVNTDDDFMKDRKGRETGGKGGSVSGEREMEDMKEKPA